MSIDPNSAERERIVAWLRRGVTYAPDGQAWGWDSEMHSYAKSFAEAIELGDHLKATRP